MTSSTYRAIPDSSRRVLLVLWMFALFILLGTDQVARAEYATSTEGSPVFACAQGRDEGCVATPRGGIATTPAAATTSSNVLFIPGTLTSRLYMRNSNGSERDLWEPRSDLDIGTLEMKSDGTSMNEIYTRDIIDRLYSNDELYGTAISAALKDAGDTYGPFEKFMNDLVSAGTIQEWKAFPYDWRYDVSDIVKDGTLVGTATSSPERVRIQDVLYELASTSPTGKVTVIAHSNGGLIAKALAVDLESTGEAGLIDKIIMIGTPQFGTPKSITNLLHGDEFTQLGGLLMYSDTVRNVEKTMPGAYDLLPSPAYFSSVPTPVATFDSQKPAVFYQQVIGASIKLFSQLFDFITDAFHLDASAGLPGSTKTPIALTSSLVKKAEATHATIDNWIPSAGIDVIAIAGWGQLTPYQTNYTGMNGLTCDRTNFFVPIACSLLPQIKPTDSFTENGDDTVIAGSARGLTANALFFNSKKYSDDTKKIIVHRNLLSAPPMQDVLKDLITNGTTSAPYFSTEIPASTESAYTVVSAHSPANLLATDGQGNETGIVPIAGLTGIYFEKEEIPGSSVHVIDDEKYLYLPSGLPYTVVMQGYDIGTTTIDIETVANDGSRTLLNEFKDILTTASTSVRFFITADGNASSDQYASTSVAHGMTESRPSLPDATPSPAATKIRSSHSAILSGSYTVPSIVHTWMHFIENVSLHGFTRQEAIEALITIGSSLNSTTVYSTVFVTLLPLFRSK